jgi:chemotaxis protein CheD
MNHFLLPEWRGEELPSGRFGNVAIHDLVEAMLARGAFKRNLQAMVFGGAIVLDSNHNLNPVGSQNIAVAFRMLAVENIPVLRNEVGGQRGRRISFDLATGIITSKVV